MSGKNGLSRRTFIASTAGAAAGSVALSSLATTATASQDAGEDKNKRPIRVGLIRCDTHGMYFGALMDKHDPLLLLHPPRISGVKDVYSWQGGGIHNYFYTSYYDQTKMTVPSVDGFEIVKVWDRHPSAAKVLSKVLHGKPKVCKKFDEVSDDVDLVFVADCTGDGSDHLKLAKPGLTKAVATFVDKPFAYDVKNALEMIALADKHKAPLMSLSMLRVLPQAGLFRNRIAEVGDLQSATFFVSTAALAGQIHAISLTHHLFGTGVESVQCMGGEEPVYIHLDYGDKENGPIKGVLINGACGKTPHCAMFASAYGDLGDVHSPPMGDYVFPYGAAEILKMVKKMVRTGKSQIDRREMVESIAIAEAARLALAKKRRVCLKEIMDTRISTT